MKVSNKGLKLSSGEFVMFANYDDYVTNYGEDLVKKLFDFKSADLAFSEFSVDDSDEILGIGTENEKENSKNFCPKVV